MTAKTRDVVVVGGGLAGAAAARELAALGLHVDLVEARGFAHGAASRGVRLVAPDVGALAAGRPPPPPEHVDALLGLAPFLIRALPIVVRAPGGEAPFALSTSGLHVVDEARAEAIAPGLAAASEASHLAGTAIALDVAQLTFAFVNDARLRGARLRESRRVMRLGHVDERIAVVLETAAGDEETWLAHAVVLAAGHASAELAAGLDDAPVEVPTTPVLQLRLDRALGGAALSVLEPDALPLGVVPFAGETVVSMEARAGTSIETAPTAEDIRDLSKRVQALVPELADAPLLSAEWMRVSRRGSDDPLPTADASTTLVAFDGFPVVSIPLAAARMAARLARSLRDHDVGPEGRVTFPSAHLAGGEAQVAPVVVAERYGVPVVAVERLVGRRGVAAHDILRRTDHAPHERHALCRCVPVLECEAVHALRSGEAQGLEDLRRRTGLGDGSCGGLHCALRASQLLARERALAPEAAEREALRLLERRRALRRTVPSPASGAAETLSRCAHQALGIPELPDAEDAS